MSPVLISDLLAKAAESTFRPVRPSQLVGKLVNPIREVVSKINLSGSVVDGKSFLNLGLGDPSVFGNMPPPIEAVDAIANAVRDGKALGYPQSIGYDETRQAVADYFDSEDWRVEKKDVIMSLGASGALEMAFAILADSTSNVLLPRPLFTAYETMLVTTGAEIRYYELDEEKNWEVDLESLEKQIDDNTAFILINNPSNPCGSNFSAAHLRDIAALAKRRQQVVITDEVYAGMAWSVSGEQPAKQKNVQGRFNRGLFTPYATVAGSSPVLVVSALSKRWLAPGWRCGWLIVHDPLGVMDAVRLGLGRFAFRIQGPASPIQVAIPTLLANTPEAFFDETLVTLRDVGTALHARLSKIEGLNPLLPQGAMYLMCGITSNGRSIRETYPAFNDDREFITAFFNEENVLVLPGACFRLTAYLRFVTTVPLPVLLAACDRLEVFCARHRAPVVE